MSHKAGECTKCTAGCGKLTGHKGAHKGARRGVQTDGFQRKKPRAAASSDAEAESSSDEEEGAEGQAYEVSKILKKRHSGEHFEWLVSWKGYIADHDSWEPLENIDTAPEKIAAFERELHSAQATLAALIG